MLKLYTDTSFLTETYRRQVFPLLFDLVYQDPKQLLDYYTLVPTIATADVVVLPIDYVSFLKHKSAFSNLLTAAAQAKLPIWIYTAGDYGVTNTLRNSYTFRLGGFDSQLDDGTFIMPSFINDPYDTYLPQGFSILKKVAQPSIGFVGHAQSGVLKYLKEHTNHLKYHLKRQLKLLHADAQAFYPSSIKRAKYLKALALNKNLDTTFILRDKYRAGSHTVLTQKESAQQFYDTIFNTAYTFCSRGVGNFSVRFYETLAVGRIPVLLDTDCRLPLHNQIDWSKHCLILNDNEENIIADQILEFHCSLSESEFEDLQQSNRDLWLNTLRRTNYFKAIEKQFNTKEQ